MDVPLIGEDVKSGGGDLRQPEAARKNLYPSITPVNTFRVLFNHLFSTHYDLLEDRVYFSCSEQLFKFIDVTNQTENANGSN